jgi:Domain of unknown function (DUF4268)
MRVIFKTTEYKELFDLTAQDRDKIEQETGLHLLWNHWPTEAHIAIERDDMDPRDVGDWKRQHEWLSQVVSAFEIVIAPRVAKLPRIAS